MAIKSHQNDVTLMYLKRQINSLQSSLIQTLKDIALPFMRNPGSVTGE